MRLLYLYAEEFTGTRAREVHTINRAHSLARSGVEVDLVGGTSKLFPTAESLLRHFGLEPVEKLRITFLSRRFGVRCASFLSSNAFYRRVGKWLDKENRGLDCAYVIHLKAADYLEDSWPGIPLVFEAHEIFAESHQAGSPKFKTLSAQEQRVYPRALAVVATSNYLLGTLRDRYELPARTQVIPNSVDSQFFDVPLDRSEPNRVIYAGSFQHWKGVDLAVAAMRELPGFQLEVFGGTQEQIAALRSDAPANAKFHGYTPQSEIRIALARASIALIPNRLAPKSSLYTFPMKLLEYAAAGRMVVSSDLPVLRELKLGEWARVVPAEDTATLARAIRESQPSLRLRSQARDWARNFTWDTQAKALQRFLEFTLVKP